MTAIMLLLLSLCRTFIGSLNDEQKVGEICAAGAEISMR